MVHDGRDLSRMTFGLLSKEICTLSTTWGSQELYSLVAKLRDDDSSASIPTVLANPLEESAL